MTKGSPPVDGPHTFRYSIDQSCQPILAIVEAVSWVKGVDARELEPLESAVDVKHLTRLFEDHGRPATRDAGRSRPTDLEVTFQYEGCLVTVTVGGLRVEAL